MSQHFSSRTAFTRLLIVTITAVLAMMVSAAASSASIVSNAEAASRATDGALGLGAARSPLVLGMSVGTFAWVSIGLILLVVGFVSASKPGQRSHRRGSSAAAVQVHEPSDVTEQSQGDLLKATLAVS